MNSDNLHHNDGSQSTTETPHSPSHGSFSLPASVIATDTIDQLLAFAFDVLDLNSIALRVYESGDTAEQDDQ